MTELDENYIIQEYNKSNEDFRIFKKDNIIFLQSIKRNDWLTFSINFSSNNFIRRKNQANSQDIIKAIGIKGNLIKPKVLDTTAGQGRDSFILASLGCNITLLERNKVIYLLLKNAIEKYSQEYDNNKSRLCKIS